MNLSKISASNELDFPWNRVTIDYFGNSVSVHNDTCIVGAYVQDFDVAGGYANSVNDAGAAYIFTRQGNVWTQQQKLIASGTNGRLTTDYFGISVSVYGDTCIVGDYFQSYDAVGSVSLPNAGAAFVYTRQGNVWTLQQKLVGSGINGRKAVDYFGRSVSIYENTCVVGAYLHDYDGDGSNNLAGAGAAFVYTRQGSVWTLQQKLVGSGVNSRLATDYLGYSVSICSDICIVGSYLHDFDAAGSISLDSAGAAYVYTRQGDVWTQQQKLVGSGTNGRSATDYFGYSVSVYADTCIVGSYYHDFDGNGSTSVSDAGAAYVYTRQGNVWTQQQKLVGSGVNGRIAADYFGNLVSVYADTCIVGSLNQSFDANGSNSLIGASAAYVYTRQGDVWTQQQKLVGSGTNGRLAYDIFGTSVSICSDTCIVGAYQQDFDGNGSTSVSDAGAAYIFTIQGGVLTQQQKLVGSGNYGRTNSDYFGYSTCIYSDTCIVGAYNQCYDSNGLNSLTYAGAAYIFTRDNGPLQYIQQKLVGSGTNGRLASDQFGWSVSVFSDTCIVGAYLQDFDAAGSSVLASAGAAYVYTRQGNVWTQQQKLVGSGTNGRIANDYFGSSVSIYADTCIVGAYLQDYNDAGAVRLFSAGAAYVYTRQGNVWTQQQKLVGSGTNGRILTDYFGYSVSVYADTCIVGAYLQDYDAAGSVRLVSTGAAYVYTRQGDVWTQQQKLIGSGTNGRLVSDYFGHSVSVYADTIVVGAHGQDFDAAGTLSRGLAGAAYVYTRQGDVWTQQQKLVGSGTNGRLASDYFGYSVSVYGNNCIVGAYQQDYDAAGSNSLTSAGAAYVYTNSGGVWTQIYKLVGTGTNGRIATDQFGYSVSCYE